MIFWRVGRRFREEDGFALVSVLWGMIVLGVIAAGVVRSSSLSYAVARNGWERLGREEALKAGLNRAVLGIMDSRPEKRWRVDGTPSNFDFNGIHATISIQDELGRIDLNYADDALLDGLFRSAGVSEDEAQGLVAKVLDWREPGDQKRLKGAKRRDYLDAGYSYAPRAGPFQSVDELKLVMGMTNELFDRIKPAITIYSQRIQIDRSVAPRETLLALPDMTPAEVDQILAARKIASSSGVGSPLQSGPGSLAGRAFSILVKSVDGDEVAEVYEVVRLTGDPIRPVLVQDLE